MTITASITETALLTAVRSVLLGMVPSAQIIQGQQNRAALPEGDFVVMTSLMRERLSTNSDSYTSSTRTVAEAAKVTIQTDIYGPNAADNAQIVQTLWRDTYACDAFTALSADVQPLYASEPRKVPFINSATQYEARWNVDLVLQANIALTLPQQTADVLAATLINVDATYPAA